MECDEGKPLEEDRIANELWEEMVNNRKTAFEEAGNNKQPKEVFKRVAELQPDAQRRLREEAHKRRKMEEDNRVDFTDEEAKIVLIRQHQAKAKDMGIGIDTSPLADVALAPL